jgi:hypothetical protein
VHTEDGLYLYRVTESPVRQRQVDKWLAEGAQVEVEEVGWRDIHPKAALRRYIQIYPVVPGGPRARQREDLGDA